MLHLSVANARSLLLAAQGLLYPPSLPASKEDVLEAVRRMGALQIDTIHVVARSPYLVLWSRLGSYEPRWLDELVEEGKLFEGWSHEASFLPIEDYPLYRRLMLDGRDRSRTWLAAHPEDVTRVVAMLAEREEVRSADFERTDGRKGTWWDWKPEKRALEALLAVGEVMVARRERFQRIYTLRQRRLPQWSDAAAPAYETARRVLTLKAVKSLGVATAAWVPDYFRLAKEGVAVLLAELAEKSELVPARLEGLDAPAYIHPDHFTLAERAIAGELASEVTTILSPFDPVVWDRSRAEALFGFRYRLECYTPAEKRQYGYFCLPILHCGRLVGRLDAKAHRQQGIFEVRSLHLGEGVEVDEPLVAGLSAALQACAAWHGTPELKVQASNPPELAERLVDSP